ncbi:MAG TPA: hypothetical protein VLZ72_05760, partial [Flavobacterium sp.]|nr:hypothetical protein [Flavobacterium sp.]
YELFWKMCKFNQADFSADKSCGFIHAEIIAKHVTTHLKNIHMAKKDSTSSGNNSSSSSSSSGQSRTTRPNTTSSLQTFNKQVKINDSKKNK